MASFCAAIRQDGYPCQNHARINHDTCFCHKNFYDKSNWIARFLSAEAEDYPLLGYPETLKIGRITKHVETTLSSGRIRLTKEDIKQIPALDKLTDAYLILCRQPSVKPKWNKQLFLAIGHYFRLFQMGNLEDEQRFLEAYELRMAPLVENPNLSLVDLLKCMTQVKQKFETTERLIRGNLHRLPFEQIFVRTLRMASQKDSLCWYSSPYLLKVACFQGQEEFFSEEILRILRENRQQICRAKKDAIDPLKEELVANVFHPRRVEKWLNEGGFELLDMMF